MDYSGLTIVELMHICVERKIKYYRKMKKNKMIEMLKDE